MFYVVKMSETDSRILDIYRNEDDANDCMDNYYNRYPNGYFDVFTENEMKSAGLCGVARRASANHHT